MEGGKPTNSEARNWNLDPRGDKQVHHHYTAIDSQGIQEMYLAIKYWLSWTSK